MLATIESWYKAIEVCGNVLFSTKYTLDSINNSMSKASSADKAGEYYALQQQFVDAAVEQMNYLRALNEIESTIWGGSQSSIDARIPNDANYQLHALANLAAQSPPIPPVILSYNIDNSGKFLYVYDAKDKKPIDNSQLKTLVQLLTAWRTANGFSISDDSVLTDSSGKPIDKVTFDAAFNDKKRGFAAIAKSAAGKGGKALNIETNFIAGPSQTEQQGVSSGSARGG